MRSRPVALLVFGQIGLAIVLLIVGIVTHQQSGTIAGLRSELADTRARLSAAEADRDRLQDRVDALESALLMAGIDPDTVPAAPTATTPPAPDGTAAPTAAPTTPARATPGPTRAPNAPAGPATTPGPAATQPPASPSPPPQDPDDDPPLPILPPVYCQLPEAPLLPDCT